MDGITTTFGERLLHLRKAKCLTQQELAQQLSVSQACINRYEHGQDKPGYHRLILRAKILETTTDFLLGLTDFEKIPGTPDTFLTPLEWELVGHFRRLPIKGRERALGYLQGVAENKQ